MFGAASLLSIGDYVAQKLETHLNIESYRKKGYHRNKLFVMDNASSHRNPEVKRYIERNNSLLYSVLYQHYTNAIENFFSGAYEREGAEKYERGVSTRRRTPKNYL